MLWVCQARKGARSHRQVGWQWADSFSAAGERFAAGTGEIAILVLGVVHPKIRSDTQRLDIRGIVGEERDADARAHADGMAFHIHGRRSDGT